MLMSPNKDETAVHGCHCLGDMAVRMPKVLATPRSWWCVLLADLWFSIIFVGVLYSKFDVIPKVVWDDVLTERNREIWRGYQHEK